MIKRKITHDVLEGARYFPVIGILGPRQSGKTTLARELFKDHVYLSLEDLDLRATAKSDPRTFLLANRNDHGIIIDEFQYVPELLSYIQTTVDQDQKTGYFVLTGSQNFLMNEAIAQSLAGRISLHTLLPLSILELKESDMLPSEIEPMLYQGCYPAIYSKNIPPDKLYKNYLKTYIERDVRQLTNIGDLDAFQTFIKLCAARVGQLVNFTVLGNDANVSDATVRRWLSILEASYIIFRVHPYYENLGKRIVKAAKLYFYDPGLICSLLQIKQEDLISHPNKGNIFESFIIADIFKHYYNQGIDPRIYFWRDKAENEVDCIIEENQKLIPIEIKSGRTFNTRFLDGLNYWNALKHKKSTTGFIIFAGSSQQIRGHNALLSWQSIDELFKKPE
ncbi:MAG: ATP-binding protein [Candidatus Babeliales bacterium]